MQKWCIENKLDLDRAIEVGRGRRTEDTVALLAPSLSPIHEAKKIESYEKELSKGIKAIPGSCEFLAQLPKELWAVVTSSTLDLAKAKIESAGLPIPSYLISADDVNKGKPHPEPYLMAISALGVAPHECVAFEDADSGVKSAVSAGCEVIVIGSNVSIRAPQVRTTVSDYRQLKLSVSSTILVEIANT